MSNAEGVGQRHTRASAITSVISPTQGEPGENIRPLGEEEGVSHRYSQSSAFVRMRRECGEGTDVYPTLQVMKRYKLIPSDRGKYRQNVTIYGFDAALAAMQSCDNYRRGAPDVPFRPSLPRLQPQDSVPCRRSRRTEPQPARPHGATDTLCPGKKVLLSRISAGTCSN